LNWQIRGCLVFKHGFATVAMMGFIGSPNNVVWNVSEEYSWLMAFLNGELKA
jgi:hypothetical protein